MTEDRRRKTLCQIKLYVQRLDSVSAPPKLGLNCLVGKMRQKGVFLTCVGHLDKGVLEVCNQKRNVKKTCFIQHRAPCMQMLGYNKYCMVLLVLLVLLVWYYLYYLYYLYGITCAAFNPIFRNVAL